MTVSEFISKCDFKIINEGDTDIQLSKVFCCDLLSIAMSRAPAGGAWVTVMGNINTLAVASLTETAVIILAEGASLDEAAAARAKMQDITVLATELPIFEAAVSVDNIMSEGK